MRMVKGEPPNEFVDRPQEAVDVVEAWDHIFSNTKVARGLSAETAVPSASRSVQFSTE